MKMKLILSLSLIWMLSSTAAALQCHSTEGSSNDIVLQTCKSDDDLCATIAHQHFERMLEMTKVTVRSCLPSFLCNKTFSQSYDAWKLAASVHCCNTDGCINQHVPYPDVHAKNGLKCVSCISQSHLSSVCNETVECVGVQDRCFSLNGIIHNNPYSLQGCVSASVCEVFPQLRDGSAGFNMLPPGELKCCGTSFCNSARAIKLSVGPVLLGLISLFIY